MPTEEKLIRFDWAIKTLPREKANFDVLEGFLSALLAEPIVIEHILESESNAEAGQKYNRVDLLVHDAKGRKLIIEVQNQHESDYMERLLFGTSKVVVENMPLGKNYRRVVKVISISILYFNLGVGDDYVYRGATEFRGLHTGHALDVRERVKALQGDCIFQSKNIFPDYYLIHVERFQDVIQSELDEWIYLLKHSAVRADFRSPAIDKARRKLALMKMRPEDRRRYERYVESVVIERDLFRTAKEDGWFEGWEEGQEKGTASGRRWGSALPMARTGKQAGNALIELTASDRPKKSTGCSPASAVTPRSLWPSPNPGSHFPSPSAIAMYKAPLSVSSLP
uniref:PD-(D/E)XK nuclease family transposase n=1 Tax=Candidatus Kentrum eta TaxID=2126337 RepID=A0A450UBG5_9GAMM|nr:MAG: conserved hypothetical protein (putative transposase or invertase) [Candidatus Kentron sp. H]VFJ92761.1 MAG: conserved hypothetical protein (putative transposase or invertase) [Candidatus Kentron sp. H]VFJ97572.1 MAG: conserved hypothetical protein (putative transposase or invertase) [Candidatus Kentron sp. H]